MKAILNQLFAHEHLNREQARETLVRIAQEQLPPAQVAAFITVFLMRTIRLEELEGFRDALLELCLPVSLNGGESIDLCGTGGDGKNTFNISTLTALVVAGAGYKVTKHGNYGVSSVCGSSNVLEHLGYTFTSDQDTLQRQVDEANICFLHAPLFHPAMKSVAPVRRELGVKTFFNMLGPIVNPARPQYQMTGVFNLELLRLYTYLLQQENKHFAIVHSLDGYDEISLTGSFKLAGRTGEELFSPEQLNLKTLTPESLHGGETVAESAAIFTQVLEGNGTEAQNEVVMANAAMAIRCFKPTLSFEDRAAEARASLLGGKALHSFKRLVG